MNTTERNAIKRVLRAVSELDFSFGRAQNPQVQNELDVACNNLRKLTRFRRIDVAAESVRKQRKHRSRR